LVEFDLGLAFPKKRQCLLPGLFDKLHHKYA